MIHIFIGTKAQLIKMAPIMRVLLDKNIEYNFIFSGQHHSTIDELLEDFEIKKPDVILYQGNDITGIFQMAAWMIRLIFYVSKNRNSVWKNDIRGIVLNHGDTISTLLGTILAKTSGHKAAHIESGLRSAKIFNPFPEEVIRRLVFKLSDYLYCPGDWAINNVKNEGAVKINTFDNTLLDTLAGTNDDFQTIPYEPDRDFCVVSIHRFENIFNQGTFALVINLVKDIAKKIFVVFVLHKPTEKNLRKFDLYKQLEMDENIYLAQRMIYTSFIALVKRSKFVVTDGGSNQEECNYLGKPCLIMRSTTERNDGLGENAVLCDYNEVIIESFISNIESFRRSKINRAESPSKIIVNHILSVIQSEKDA